MGKTTSKKIKVIGHQQYVNPQTGELMDFAVTSVEDRDYNFHKVWLQHLFLTIDLLGTQKMRFAMWLIDNMNGDNQIIMTYRKMAETSGISLDTVRKTMGILKDADFLREQQRGVYILNPDIIFKGSHNKRMGIAFIYNGLEHEELPTAQKIANLQEVKDEIDAELEVLEAKQASEQAKVPND